MDEIELDVSADEEESKAKAILALEVKLALLRGEEPPVKNYGRLLDMYDEQIALGVLKSCRKTFYTKISKRQNRSLEDQAATYDLPIPAGERVNVPSVLTWFHDWLATNGPKLKKMADAKDRKAALEEQKLEQEVALIRSKMVDMEISIQKKLGTAVPIEEVRSALTWLSTEWRKFGERLGSKFGADSQRFLNEFLERIEEEVVDFVPVASAPPLVEPSAQEQPQS